MQKTEKVVINSLSVLVETMTVQKTERIHEKRTDSKLKKLCFGLLCFAQAQKVDFVNVNFTILVIISNYSVFQHWGFRGCICVLSMTDPNDSVQRPTNQGVQLKSGPHRQRQNGHRICLLSILSSPSLRIPCKQSPSKQVAHLPGKLVVSHLITHLQCQLQVAVLRELDHGSKSQRSIGVWEILARILRNSPLASTWIRRIPKL